LAALEDKKEDKRMKTASSLAMSFAKRPFNRSFVFILLSLKATMVEKHSLRLFQECFKAAFEGLREEDIDFLVLTAEEEVLEVTSKEFKAESKGEKEVLLVVTRIEKNEAFKELKKRG